MSSTLAEIRPGAYYDSVVLMQLQRALADLPGVDDAGVVMCTPANKELLEQSDLLTPEIQAAAPEDLVIVVRAAAEESARAALAQVDELLARRRSSGGDEDYRPKSLASAAKMLPEARWVLISVPGRYAAGVARQALELGKNVFLYSDNVPAADEIALKTTAAEKGLLLMGPDCGTAIVDGVGLGFANRVRRGNIGVVAASGTGLQAVTVGIHRAGGGITQAFGTGGRDLSEAVGAVTAKAALARLANDPQTEVIVLVSKPPAPAVAEELLSLARQSGKPVVVDFIGFHSAAGEQLNAKRQRGKDAKGDRLFFVETLDEAAEVAVALAMADGGRTTQYAIRNTPNIQSRISQSPIFLRALYSGGTLAYEALLLLQDYLPTVYSNAPLKGGPLLANPHESRGHTVVDLGEDEFTVGRLHPMLDNDLRIRRILAEAADPETGLLLLDVVLGDGAHPDPAGELAPAIREAIATTAAAGRALPVVAVVVGTDADPQGLERQIEQLQEAGAVVFTRHDEAVRAVGAAFAGDGRPQTADRHNPTQYEIRNTQPANPIPNTQYPLSLAALNVGLESFTDSLKSQSAAVVHVEWRPPAGGNERLMGLLARMRR